MNTIGFKIRDLRFKNNLSQDELAIQLGIGQAALCKIESGKTKEVSFALMDKVCKIFDVDFDYFNSDGNSNNINKIEGGVVGFNNTTINMVSEDIIEQLKFIIEDSKKKDKIIKNQETLIKKLQGL